MDVSPAWRMFRRMQYSAFAAGALIYAAAAVHAWTVLPAAQGVKLQRVLIYPGVMFLATLLIPLVAPPLRHMLKTHIFCTDVC